MQKIFFHKVVHLSYPLKELISISVDESIQYKIEINGMRAIGSIIIRGEYDDGNKKNHFHESINLDILAQFDKIVNKKDFYMKVEDFDYSIQNGILKLIIQTHIYGVKDDNDKHIHVDEEPKMNEPDVIETHIESLLRKEDTIEMNNDEVNNVVDTEILESQTINQYDDIDDEDIGTYYFYIVQDGDTYNTIASRYDLDVNVIREYNHNREIQEGNIIIIPYLS